MSTDSKWFKSKALMMNELTTNQTKETPIMRTEHIQTQYEKPMDTAKGTAPNIQSKINTECSQQSEYQHKTYNALFPVISCSVGSLPSQTLTVYPHSVLQILYQTTGDSVQHIHPKQEHFAPHKIHPKRCKIK